jgi:hypothetical protein
MCVLYTIAPSIGRRRYQKCSTPGASYGRRVAISLTATPGGVVERTTRKNGPAG